MENNVGVQQSGVGGKSSILRNSEWPTTLNLGQNLAHTHTHGVHPHVHTHNTNSHLNQNQPQSLNIHEHIQRCTCTCDHMGYGNYLDYQGSNSIELPDVSRVSPVGFTTSVVTSIGGGQNGSAVRINGGTNLIEQDSLSSNNSKDDNNLRQTNLNHTDTRGVELKMRHWLLVCCVLLLAAAVGVGVGVPLAIMEDFVTSPRERLETVQQILREVPLVDGHNDLPWNIRKFVHNQIQDFNFSSDLRKVEPWSRSTWSHTDLIRLKEGLVGCQVQLALEQIDVIRRLTEKYSNALKWVKTAEEIEKAHRRGKIASMIGVEGGHTIGNSIAVLRMFYSLGARYLTLTHSCSTPWADCSSVDEKGSKTKSSGLKEFGKTVIKEMNRLGMIVDLSHVSQQTMRDALDATRAPVIFSHSSAQSLCNSSRNVPDDILRRVRENGGLVMVNFYSYFISCNESASVNDVIAHINHIKEVAGIDHVGIGAGYDGINFTPRGLEDVSKYPNLFSKLLEDTVNWSVDDLKKLAGLNFLRVLRDVESVRDKWSMAAVEPVEDLIPNKLLEGVTNCVYAGS